jgi:GT2 family glycosyltransferase
MGLDLELRYAALARETDHVCTGNSAYRAEALDNVGLFDERLGYGYDNDMSYRLKDAGYSLLFCRDATSTHRWREGFRAYCVQQYGFGYGRLDLVAKHPRRASGDRVSPFGMILHPVAMAAAVVCAAGGGLAALMGGSAAPATMTAAAIVAGLTVERSAAAVRAVVRFGDPAAFLFPLLHLARDLSWVAALVFWSLHRLARRDSRPSDSMAPRSARPPRYSERRMVPRAPRRVIGIIPAHNEAANLPAVIAELRTCHPGLDVLVVDDGSTDGTSLVLESLGCRWLAFPERLGIGNAMRAGLRYAVRLGYDGAVRLDGDGQHSPDEIERILEPLMRGEADVAVGSRFIAPGERSRPGSSSPAGGRGHGGANRLVRLAQRLLARCLSALTGAVVTDPTSGFYALGPRALRLLVSHHPTGYPEPELHLFLSRNDLAAIEVPVRSRPRLGGRTTLMPTRWTTAAARVLLALLVVPLRGAVEGHARD